MHSSKTAFTVLLQCLLAVASYLPRSHSSAPISLGEGTRLVDCEVSHPGELAHALTLLDSNVHLTIIIYIKRDKFYANSAAAAA